MENEQRKQKPQIVFRCGSVRASVWFFPKEIDGETVDVPSVTISKSYMDKKTGEWVNTPFLRSDELLKAAMVATEAYRRLRLRTFEPEKSKNSTNDKDSLDEYTDDFIES